MRKRDSEYHTGRLNISCSPSVKDAIAADATKRGQSISQFMLSLYEESAQAGTSSHLARMGLEIVGLKKRLIDIDMHLRKLLMRSRGVVDPAMREDLVRLKQLEDEIDEVLRETIATVKVLKEREGAID